MKILVTGATGYVGRKLIPKLLELGHEVIALARSTSNTASIPEGVEIRDGDMLDHESLEAAVQGAEIVVHLAAYFDFYPKDTDLMFKVNVEGTLSLMNACVGTSVERFIYVSSTEAIGPVKFPPGNEDTELVPTFAYGETKVLAERGIREISTDTKLAHIILRPTGIVGEGELYTAFEAIQAINDRQLFVIPGDGEKTLMYTYIEDVLTGIISALTTLSALNNTLILCPDAPMTYNELFQFVADCLGVKPPKRHIPTFLAKIGIGMLSPFKNRGKNTFLWHMKTIESLDQHRWFQNDRAKKLLGWAPAFTMQEGIKRSIEWYFENGHLERKE